MPGRSPGNANVHAMASACGVRTPDPAVAAAIMADPSAGDTVNPAYCGRGGGGVKAGSVGNEGNEGGRGMWGERQGAAPERR